MENFYLVVGCHRSGTSLISGLLHNSGIDMGQGHFGKSGADNPTGYFEDRRFRRINDNILKFNRYDVKSWQTPIPAIKGNKALNRQILSVLRGVDDGVKTGAKDPRFCLTWPVWRKLIPIDTTIVYVYRNPVSVANSLIKRGNITTVETGLKIWNVYNERALSIQNHFKTVYIQYERVMQEGEIKPLEIKDIKGLIDADLYTNKSDSIPELNRKVWSTLKKYEKA